jgi:hypothetical protein
MSGEKPKMAKPYRVPKSDRLGYLLYLVTSDKTEDVTGWLYCDDKETWNRRAHTFVMRAIDAKLIDTAGG